MSYDFLTSLKKKSMFLEKVYFKKGCAKYTYVIYGTPVLGLCGSFLKLISYVHSILFYF